MTYTINCKIKSNSGLMKAVAEFKTAEEVYCYIWMYVMSDFNKKNFNYNIKPYVVPSPNEIEQMACEYPIEIFGCEGLDGDYVFYKVMKS